jgi:transcription initiation factor TFIID subunit 9B
LSLNAWKLLNHQLNTITTTIYTMAEPNGTQADVDTLPNSQAGAGDPMNAQNSVDAKSDGPVGSSEAPGSRKPRDARIIHLILASMNVTSYQERVPLMLMDFAYRLSSLQWPRDCKESNLWTGYTSSVLQDALLFSDAINSTSNTGGTNPPAQISLNDLRMSVASRINHQFNTSLPKEFLLDIAQERNKVALPIVGKEFGVRLPPEKYCLTGINWDLSETREDWMVDSDDDEEPEYGTGLVGGGGGGGAEGGMEVDELFGGEGAGGGADSLMADA